MRHVAAVGARVLGVAGLLLVGLLMVPSASGASSLHASGSSTGLTVSAVDNIYGAGLSVAPAPGGGGGGSVPVDVPIPAGTTWLTFSNVAGTVYNTTGASNGPDGRAGETGITAAGSLSGITDSTSLFFMLGVFLDGPQPSPATTPPTTLDFSGDASFPSLSPQLDQVFFVGDGLTGTGSGNEQYFEVPAGATDLYLGFADGAAFNGPTGTYDDNSGSLSASVNFFTGTYAASTSSGATAALLGGLNVAGYCQSVDNTTAELAKGGIDGTNYAYDNWECSGTGQTLDLTTVCKWQYASQAKDAVAKSDDANDAYSWECFAGKKLRGGASTGANLVKDGGFEHPVVSGQYQTIAGGAALGPWTVTGNSVDVTTSAYLASHRGSQEVDLDGSNFNGSSAGGVYQDLATRPGETYLLTYWEGANPGGAPTVKVLDVSFGGHSVGSTSYTVGSASPYVKYSFDVTAKSTTSRLAFSTPQTTVWGPLLDAVSVVPDGRAASAVARGDVAPIAASIGTPGQIFHSMGHNVVNAVITVAAILFITFPSVVFNQTFASNYDEILLMLASFRRRVRRTFGLKERDDGDAPIRATAGHDEASQPGRASRTRFYGVLIVGAVLGGLLNPKFGFNTRSLVDIGATLVAFALGTSIGWYIAKAFRKHHHYPVHTYLHALPLGLGVAALCVVVSRLTNFEPGYLYGIVVSIAFVETLEERHNAHLTTISSLSTLGVALLAWFLWIPTNHFALEHSGNILLAIVDDVLASVFIGGLVGTVIGLLPLEFMAGGTIAKWRKDVWAVLFFVALFLLVEVELRPAAGPTHPGGAPIVTVLVLFVIFGGGSFWMRHYFAKRKAAKTPPSDVLATQAAPATPEEAAPGEA